MRRYLLTTLTVGLGCTLSGCSGGGGSTTPAQAAGAPAVSRQQAQQVLTAYQAAVTKADQALDDKALGTLESGPQLQMDTAVYKLHRATKQKYAPVAYTAPAFYIPRLTGYPRWFAVDGTQGKAHRALLFQQQSAAARWLLVAAPAGTEPLSRIELDSSGLATPVSSDATLAISPAKLPSAHAELLTAGPKSPGAARLAAGGQTSQAYAGLQQARAGFAKLGVTLTTQFQPAGQPVYALRTTGGGAVVWYMLQQQESYVARKAGAISVTGDLVGLAPAGTSDKQLTTTVLIQYLAKDPAKGKSTVTGSYRKAVQATAS